MDKLMKIIRSRFFVSGFVILLQFIQLIIVFTLLYNNFTLMVILGCLFYIGVFLYIINKYKSPEFKLPWTIIMMLFFVFGAFIFILSTGNEENKKLSSKYQRTSQKLQPYLKNNNLEDLKQKNNIAYLQANYINKVTGLPCYQNTKISYYKLGEEFHKELLESLKKAQSFILMEYFIIEEGVMWNPIHEILKEKVASGVKVYVIYDDFGCMITLNEKYYQQLNEEGINCIPTNKLKPALSNTINNRDHRKITVIDGVVGFTGGINLADEYINAKVKHGHWKDTAIKLEGEAVKSLTAMFLEMWNTFNKIELSVNDFMRQESKKKKDSGFVIPYGDGPEDFYRDNVGKYVYLNMLNAAQKYVYITTPYLICDYEILNALCVCAKKGIDVRIIVPHIPDKKTVFWMTQSNYETLTLSGVKIYEYTPGFIHAKQFICDDIYATCGTINLDYRSLVHHFECGVWMYNVDCIKDMKNDFIETQDISEIITKEKSKLKGWKKLVTETMKIFFPLF